ncbi:hypothetical protein B0H14DRAFT_3503211 [Mycena olivaceomarginata]|nr:hypothetical protein B0H14DRAFT_3503211 [Mycena olivaceomarginata]
MQNHFLMVTVGLHSLWVRPTPPTPRFALPTNLLLPTASSSSSLVCALGDSIMFHHHHYARTPTALRSASNILPDPNILAEDVQHDFLHQTPMTNATALSFATNLKAQKRAERNEKVQLRMAQCAHAELVLRPLEKQQLAAEHSRAYQATYQEKHRTDLWRCEAKHRAALYLACYGAEAHPLYSKARHQRKRSSASKHAGTSYDLQDLPYGFGYHPEENNGISGRTLLPAC